MKVTPQNTALCQLRIASAVLMSAAVVSAVGCGRGDASKVAPPSKVELVPHETELSRLTLTAEAIARLGITYAEIRREQVRRHTTLGGDVMIPPGRSLIVSAPVSGTIQPPPGASIPTPGQAVGLDAPVLLLSPLLTPERDVLTPAERVQVANSRATVLSALTIAEGDVERSQAEVEGARIALERAEQLFADKAGAKRAVDDAQAVFNMAEATLRAATERRRQLSELVNDLEAPAQGDEAAEPLVISSPLAGIVRTLNVSLGQTVTANAPLFEVVDITRLWVRVPLYVGMVSDMDPGAEANLVELNGKPTDSPRPATPVAAPPSADPLSVTADLYFEVQNPDGALRPGQRVGMDLELKDNETALVAPSKSVLYDIYGGTWVYVQTEKGVFERRRIVVQYTSGDQVVLTEGPEAGTEVVVDGAAELFGTEFGIGK